MTPIATRLARILLAAAGLLGAVILAAQEGEPPDFTVAPAERKAALEGVVAKLNENYVFPETARKMESALRARIAKKEYDSITSARELAAKLTTDLREVSRDKHLHVLYFREGTPPDPPEEDEPRPTAEQRAWLAKVNFGFEKVERLRGNVGYLDIRGFVPAAVGGETATAAMSFLANTDALIVDLRKNGGGEPSMIAYVTSYLFDRPTHLNDIWERRGNRTHQWWTLPHVPGARFGGTKPVYVLTSAQTFSGGEEFAYNLKNTKRATVVGETTGGGAHPVRPYKVSEHFAIGVPFARAVSPITKSNWEGTGVAPDVRVPAAGALDRAYVLALERGLEGTKDPSEREEFRKLIEEIRTKN